MHQLLASQEDFLDHIKNPALSSDAKRFGIYYNNWRLGLTKVLAEHFPVCKRLVGDRFFQGMSQEYIKIHPSTYFSLNEYGVDFPDFVKQFTPAASLPYLSDVAKLEWAIHRALIGESSMEYNPQTLSDLLSSSEKQKKFQFGLTKNGTLISSIYPIHRIWETNQPDYEGDETVNLDEGGVRLFIWRKVLDLRIDRLEEVEWQILKIFQEKRTFEEIYKAEINTVDSGSLLNMLPKFFEKGYLTP